MEAFLSDWHVWAVFAAGVFVQSKFDLVKKLKEWVA